MTTIQPRSGYTLPVFACASAVAALHSLRDNFQPIEEVKIDLIEPSEIVIIPIEQVAKIKPNSALAITRSDPGDNLDLTRNTPVWAMVEFLPEKTDSESIIILGGEGIGYHQDSHQSAIYRYAKQVLFKNLQPLLKPQEKIQVTIILPEGRQLAKRTSNEAFGIVKGLSLLGTSGISQPLSVPEQLEIYQAELQQKALNFKTLVFCLGENGLDFAQRLGIPANQVIKTANWLGPMLGAAALADVQSILLFGYHGKLIKLAGGIFHTHHYLADARREILTAFCANCGLPTSDLQHIFQSPTAEDALQYLRQIDALGESNWVSEVYGAIAAAIDSRSTTYIYTQTQKNVEVGSILFDRKRKMIIKSEIGDTLLSQICYSNENHH